MPCTLYVAAVLSSSEPKADLVAISGGLEAEFLHPLRPDTGYFATHSSTASTGGSSEERRRGRSDSNEGYHPKLW